MAVRGLSSDHVVRCYYMSSIPTKAGTAYAIKSDINWMKDPIAFSTTNFKEILLVMSNLKECAVKAD